MSATEILEQIRQLPPEEQLKVAEKIREELGDFDDKLSPEQIAELDRRADDALNNPDRGVAWEQLRDEVLRQHRK